MRVRDGVVMWTQPLSARGKELAECQVTHTITHTYHYRIVGATLFCVYTMLGSGSFGKQLCVYLRSNQHHHVSLFKILSYIAITTFVIFADCLDSSLMLIKYIVINLGNASF